MHESMLALVPRAEYMHACTHTYMHTALPCPLNSSNQLFMLYRVKEAESALHKAPSDLLFFPSLTLAGLC